MTPTPAQIEAAKKVIWKRISGLYINDDEQTEAECLAMTVEALTAAAEVPIKEGTVPPNYGRIFDTAATEVGEPKDNTDLAERLLEAQISNVDPEDHKTILGRWHWEIAQQINATIERCAQVAEGIGDMFTSAKIAAAIRALKDST